MFKRIKLNSRPVSLFICIFFAFCLWVYVSYVENPDMTRRISGIPVTIVGESKLNENYLALKSISKSTIDLKIKAKRNTFASLSPDNIKAKADVSSITQPGQSSVILTVEFPNSTSGITITDRNALEVKVNIEKYVTSEFNVVPNIEKKPSDGYYINTSSYSDGEITVSVSGCESDINSIAYITTNGIDLSSANDNTARTVTFFAVDKDKKNVENITFSKASESILFEIYKEALIPLTFNLTGDSEYIKAVIEPDEVVLKGPAATIDAIESINIGNINEFSYDAQDVLTYTLKAPDGTEFADGDSMSVTVTFVSDF